MCAELIKTERRHWKSFYSEMNLLLALNNNSTIYCNLSRYRQIRSERKRDAERKMFIPNGTSRINSLGELLDITGTGSGIPILVSFFYQD